MAVGRYRMATLADMRYPSRAGAPTFNWQWELAPGGGVIALVVDAQAPDNDRVRLAGFAPKAGACDASAGSESGGQGPIGDLWVSGDVSVRVYGERSGALDEVRNVLRLAGVCRALRPGILASITSRKETPRWKRCLVTTMPWLGYELSSTCGVRDLAAPWSKRGTALAPS